MSSTVSNVRDTSNSLFNNYDLRKIFVYGNRYRQFTFKNNTGAAATFTAGLLLAKDNSDNTIVPLDASTTTNASNIPIGILAQDLSTSIANGATQTNVYFCVEGDVARDKIIFQDSANDNFTSVIAQANGRTIEDLLLVLNIRAVESTDLTNFDNS